MDQPTDSPPVARVRARLRVPPAALFWLVWLGAAAGASWFYFESPDFSAISGVGELVEAHASAPELLKVARIEASLGERVRKGQLLVSFDTATLQREREVVLARIAKAEGQFAAGAMALRRDAANDRLAFEKAFEIADAGTLGAQVQADLDRAEAESLRKQIAWWQSRVDQKLVAEQPLIELRAQLAAVQKRVDAQAAAAARWKERLQRVQGRLDEFSKVLPTEASLGDRPELQPLKAEMEILKAELAQIDARTLAAQLRAPFDGVVHRVLLQPGDVAVAGQGVLVLRKPEVDRVVGYAIGAVARRLQLGGAVRVERRDGTGQRLHGHVMGFGGVAPIPLQLQSIPPRAPLAAEEIIIGLDDGTVLPGEPVDIEFVPGVLHGPPGRKALPQRAGAEPPQVAGAPGPPGGHPPQPGPALPAQPTATTAVAVPPRLVQVPAALAQVTRLELSGLLWLPERKRFVVVSDDTGLQGKQEGAPWVFGMTDSGQLDAEPWPIAGLEGVSDLEAVTRGPDGELWLLASQSINRKGKRPEARSLLARVEVRPHGLVAPGRAHLAYARGRRAAQGGWPSLGLGGRDSCYRKGGDGFDRELDLEGIAMDGEALLLAVKHPLDDQGRALIWRLADPGRLLQTGGLADNQLTVWARVKLGVGPGAALPAGFADLLRLDDGRLLALATALGDADEGHLDRGLHSALVAITDPTGRAQVQIVENFAGLHAEGVAFGPSGSLLTVVFDRGAQPPMWAAVPAP